MGKYILKRVGMMVVTLFVIISIAFFVLRLMPGGPYDENEELTPAMVAILEAKANLDKPLPVQYLLFIKGILLENDWGVSLKIRPGLGTFDVILERIPVTMALNLCSLFISIPLGMKWGGLGCAMGSVSYPMLTEYACGKKDYAAVYGVINAMNVFGGAVCPTLTNAIYDSTGSYDAALLMAVVLLLLAVGCHTMVKKIRN